MGIDLLSLEPTEFAREGQGLGLQLAASEAALLRPDHPFVGQGSWLAFVARRHGRACARAVASIDPRQRAGNEAVGTIGFLAGAEEPEALGQALVAAEHWLADLGVSVVRCPVQFSTWYGHRAIVDGFAEEGGEPPFALEPRNPRRLPEILEGQGFVAVHRAVSHVVDNERAIAGTTRGLERILAAGYTHRALRTHQLEEEVALLHQLASEIFPGSWGFSPISLSEFQALYRPLAARVDPALVRIAEDPGGRPVGFVFALVEGRPQGPAAGEGLDINVKPRFLVKTIGVLPEARRRCPGLGSAMIAAVHSIAAGQGYRRAIHALMADGSEAQVISARWGAPFRSYATFEHRLGQGK